MSRILSVPAAHGQRALWAIGILAIFVAGNDVAADDSNITQKLSADRWPGVCARALRDLNETGDARYDVVFGTPEVIESSTPVAWLNAYGYRIPVPMLEGGEWHYRMVDPGDRFQARYGRLLALEFVREKQGVLSDIADVTGFVARTDPENTARRRTMMADIFGNTYTRDDALRHALEVVPSDIDCGRDRHDVIEDMLALTNKTDVLESRDDRVYQYFGPFDGFVVNRKIKNGTLWAGRIWRKGWRLRVRLYVRDVAPEVVHRLGVGLVHPDFVKAPAGELSWVTKSNETLPALLRKPIPTDRLNKVLGPLINNDS